MYSIMCMYHYELKYNHFILLVIIQFYLLCFVAHIFPALAIQGILVGPTDIFLLSQDFFIEHVLAFWSYKMLQEHLFTPCPSPRFSHFKKSSRFFYWPMILVTKMWLPAVSTIFNILDDSRDIWDFHKIRQKEQIIEDLVYLVKDIGQDIMAYKNSESFLMKQISDIKIIWTNTTWTLWTYQ